ncbi:MAG TPA: DUF4214 domain-containing protein [Noviherbaspirillum sp.]|uniref:DUF4214 domain-containing protein n=1 Tax=Noviherbaspirillum sp. TaxID=1926288 RepID=UPI002B4712FD|nr:DUF4214 domain-containing protein [Noviherbaspirillum sp.]HJV84320.1 DUF4214 domain-containing protein [Noviherbaspirillum sp.]
MRKLGISICTATLLLAACGGSGTDRATVDQGGTTRLAAVVKSAAAPADYTAAVQQLYVAYFGRPADSTGLTNFRTILANAGAPSDIQGLNAAYSTNATVKWAIDSFGTSDESKALYSGDTRSFVTSIYTNVLNRAPDTAGRDWWVDVIDRGVLTRGNAALSIMAGALTNTTTDGLADAALIQKRIAVATQFTSTITTPTLVAAYDGNDAAASARSMLGMVTKTTDVSAFQADIDATLSSLSSTVVLISGYATKGPMNDAKVTIYALNPDGTRGAALGSGTTSADDTGMFSVGLHTRPTTPISVSISNGSYASEYDGSKVQSTASMDAIVDSVPSGGASNVSVTPLSDMVVKRCQKLVTQGSTLSTALTKARTDVRSLYNLSADPETIVPSFNPSLASTDRFALAMALVGLESFTHSVGATATDAVYETISSDFADGTLDGKSGSTSLQYGTMTNVTSTTLKDKMFSNIRSSMVSVVNNVAPASLNSWVNANPQTASTKAIASPPAGYSCSTGYTLINESSGSPTCWDGTKADDGTPLVGMYTVCNGKKMAGDVSCTPAPTYSCTGSYQLVTDTSGNPTCWDGTRTSTGQIYLGSYYICGADNSKVAYESQCPASSTINMYQNSTTPAIFKAGTPGMLQNSTTIATYTAPQVTLYKATPIPSLSASDVSAISGTSSSWSLPSWAGLGSLNSAQLDAINQQTSLLTSFWAYH